MPSNVLDRTPPPADHRVHYGADPLQFGDLWLPSTPHPAPVCVFLHGGWWKAAYGLEYTGFLAAALRSAGIAVWSLEYRRVGHPGGGFPGTFLDVAAGFDYLPTLARSYPLDMKRVIAAGHSAGAHLAFWLAGRRHLSQDGPLSAVRTCPIPLKAVVSLAGAVDLRLTIDLAGHLTFAHDREEVFNLMGGPPEKLPEAYRAANPGDLLPLNLPQFLLQGTEDDQIPPQLPVRWTERAHHTGEQAQLTFLSGADHFDLVDPETTVWPQVLNVFRKALA